jgi:hypothetical protein
MSDEDLGILEEIAVFQKEGRPVEQTPERQAVTAQYDQATITALAERNVRFTIPEMDQLLAAE